MGFFYRYSYGLLLFCLHTCEPSSFFMSISSKEAHEPAHLFVGIHGSLGQNKGSQWDENHMGLNLKGRERKGQSWTLSAMGH
jgi:hypothetical protein